MAFPTDNTYFRRFLEECLMRPTATGGDRSPNLTGTTIKCAVYKANFTGSGYNLDTDVGYIAASAWINATYEVPIAGSYDPGGVLLNQAATMARGSTAAGSIMTWGQSGIYAAWTADTWQTTDAGEFAMVYDNGPTTNKWGIVAINIPTISPNGGASSITWSSGILTMNG